MSVGLTAVQNAEFNSQVKAAYQTAGVLHGMCRVKTGVVGASHEFRRASRTMATRRVPQTDVIPMGQRYAPAVAYLTDWNAAEYTDVFDQQKTSVEERGIVAGNIAAAIGRRRDQIKLDALDAANATATISANVGGASSGMNKSKFLAIHEILNGRGVPRDKRVLVIGARQEVDLLAIPEFSSSDYVNQKVMQTGRLPEILGFKIAVVESRLEGGLTLSSSIRTCFAYDMDALGEAVGVEPRTEVNYIPEKTSWLANGLFSAGAVVIDPEGVVEVACYEAPLAV